MDSRVGSEVDRGGGPAASAGGSVPAEPARQSNARPVPVSNPPTAELLRGIAEDASTLFRQEILLAKQELTEGMVQGAKGGSILSAAGVAGIFTLAFLLTTIAWGLVALGLAAWAGFGIVTLVLLIVTAILALVGQREMKKSKPAPARAQDQFNQTTQNLKSEAQTAAQGIQAELKTAAQEAQAEAKTVPERLRALTSRYTEQARAQINARVNNNNTRRGRGHEGG